MVRWMIIAFVAMLLLAGCTWVIDEDLIAANEAHEKVVLHQSFEEGFANGCMALIFFTAPSADEVPPFSEALELCRTVRQLAGDDRLVPADTSVPAMPVIDCSEGNCL